MFNPLHQQDIWLRLVALVEELLGWKDGEKVVDLGTHLPFLAETGIVLLSAKFGFQFGPEDIHRESWKTGGAEVHACFD